MERLVILVCVCVATTIAQNRPYHVPTRVQYNPKFLTALQRQAQPAGARPQQDNNSPKNIHQDLKIHQLQLQNHAQEIQRHLQQEQEALNGNFQPSNQQVYQQQSLQAAHQPQDQQQYYLQQQNYQQQALQAAHQPQDQQQYYLQQQNYQQQALQAAHQPQDQQQYYLQQQNYQQQALQAAHQPQDQQQYYLQQQQALEPNYQLQEPATPKNYHPPALVHKVNIGMKLQGDYDFTYDTGKGPLGQSYRTETRLPDGTVKGSYGYLDSDGRQRIVKYIAGKGGFVAEGDVGPDNA
ncbi:putative mediator of RNA polymerase II transcription subunit 26 [Limulus polyphemus]|uniref:Mediator of RNA polymerase II transcription subunit 26 n=1 Tax=Limulus polyphemus TaxID=6850 RepID=A0ABM1S591_LIMPO|nr:putative mediator of RNA polymerase II transcription subunit 26 [Limulus polyphemus]